MKVIRVSDTTMEGLKILQKDIQRDNPDKNISMSIVVQCLLKSQIGINQYYDTKEKKE